MPMVDDDIENRWCRRCGRKTPHFRPSFPLPARLIPALVTLLPWAVYRLVNRWECLACDQAEQFGPEDED